MTENMDSARSAERLTGKQRVLRGLKYWVGVMGAMYVPVLVCWLLTAGPQERQMRWHSLDPWGRLCSTAGALAGLGILLCPRRRRWHRAAAGIVVVAAGVAAGMLLSRRGECCPWHPAVNTEFAEGYSEKAFCSIRKGMSEAEVLALLGEPFRKSETMMAEGGSAEFKPVDCWHYSRKRQDKMGGFASLVRIVVFRDGTVLELFTPPGEWL